MEPSDFVDNNKDISEAHWVTLVKHWEYLVKYYKSVEEIKKIKPVFEEPRTTLEQYCKGTEVAIEPFACVKEISTAGHGRILRSVWRLLLSGKKNKRSVAWIHGISSSGKS